MVSANATAMKATLGSTMRPRLTIWCRMRSHPTTEVSWNRAKLNPATARSACAPPRTENSPMCVPTIMTIAIARIATVVSTVCSANRRLFRTAGVRSRIGVVCQPVGRCPSACSNRTDISTYDKESPPKPTNVESGVTSPRPSNSPYSATRVGTSARPGTVSGCVRSARAARVRTAP